MIPNLKGGMNKRLKEIKLILELFFLCCQTNASFVCITSTTYNIKTEKLNVAFYMAIKNYICFSDSINSYFFMRLQSKPF